MPTTDRWLRRAPSDIPYFGTNGETYLNRTALRDLTKTLPLRFLTKEHFARGQIYRYVGLTRIIPAAARLLLDFGWEFQGREVERPETWHGEREYRSDLDRNLHFYGFVEVCHRQLIWDSRTRRVYDAFVDIWHREELGVAVDRLNLNPPDIENQDRFLIPDTALAHTRPKLGGFECCPKLFKGCDQGEAFRPKDRDSPQLRIDRAEIPVVRTQLEADDLLIFKGLLAHGVSPKTSEEIVRTVQYLPMTPVLPSHETFRRSRAESWRPLATPAAGLRQPTQVPVVWEGHRRLTRRPAAETHVLARGRPGRCRVADRRRDMRRICLTLPPRRPCAATITALAEQAAHVVAHCDVTVRVLILDPCAAPASGEHHGAVRRIPAGPCIVVCCFGEERRRDFPQSGFGRSAAAKRDIPLELVLPLVFSRGACTNPALSLALGCAPVDHELLSLGRLAAYAACHLTETLIAASIVVGPMRLHMCNIPSHGVREYMPLPLAIDTGGSDNWPIHLVHNASLLGVLRDRSVVGEGGTVSRFVAYQLRHVEVLLPMLYANLANDPMVRSGASLLDAQRQVRTSGVARPARHSMRFDRSGDVPRLDVLDTAFRKLRNRYVQLADLDRRREYVLAEARSGVEDFAPLTEGWELLIGAARRTCVLRTPGQRR